MCLFIPEVIVRFCYAYYCRALDQGGFLDAFDGAGSGGHTFDTLSIWLCLSVTGGGVLFEAGYTAALYSVNVTDCAASGWGGAFAWQEAETDPLPCGVSFSVITRSSGRSAVDDYSLEVVTFQSCVFIEQYTIPCTIRAYSSDVVLLDGIFQDYRNPETTSLFQRSGPSGHFIVYDCIFSASTPESADLFSGSGRNTYNRVNDITAYTQVQRNFTNPDFPQTMIAVPSFDLTAIAQAPPAYERPNRGAGADGSPNSTSEEPSGLGLPIIIAIVAGAVVVVVVIAVAIGCYVSKSRAPVGNDPPKEKPTASPDGYPASSAGSSDQNPAAGAVGDHYAPVGYGAPPPGYVATYAPPQAAPQPQPDPNNWAARS
jgi:hypothetical protein